MRYLPFVLFACTAPPGAPAATACSGLAVELVIDRSGSMTGAPIAFAKDAARAAIDRAADGDCVGVVAFDAAPAVVVPLAPVTRAPMRGAIDAIDARGGTELAPALELARRELSRASGRRHLLLLTDGQAASGGLVDLSRAMSAEGITIAAVGLGDGVDQQLLRALSLRFYKVESPAALVQVFEQEMDAVHAR
jgi:secreted protein with Ig-like and vWFA domain